MKKALVKILTITIAAAALFTGCGINKDATFATFEGQPITMGFANFYARYQQATYDMFYIGYFGEDYWQTDLYGSGNDLETDVKAEIADSIKEMYVLDAHKGEYGVDVTTPELSQIQEAAWAFMSANNKKALKAVGASEEYITEYLRLNLISRKMREAISAKVEYDEEALRQEARETLESEAASSAESDEEGAEPAEPAEVTDEDVEDKLADLIDSAQSDGCDEIINGWVDSASWEINEDEWAKVKFDTLFKAPENDAITEDASEE